MGFNPVRADFRLALPQAEAWDRDMQSNRGISRRRFVQAVGLTAGGVWAGGLVGRLQGAVSASGGVTVTLADLPMGSAPVALPTPHFPNRLCAFVWRNWPLVPVERMAAVVGGPVAGLRQLAAAMGLGMQPKITPDQRRRSSITVIRRNWHLLPYEQLLALLEWTPEQMAFSLREDDFLYVKLGNLKPKCEALRYAVPDDATWRAAEEIGRRMKEWFPGGICEGGDPLFGFVRQLTQGKVERRKAPVATKLSPRYCYSYFALYGDPLLETEADPYPEGYLAQLATAGVDGVWLQGVLAKLAPFPWNAAASEHHAERLENLRRLVARARRQGVGIWLYLNEPRALPVRFFEQHPEKKGVVEGDYAALCSSDSEVREYLTGAVAHICREVPDLAGFFTISASENLSNCWSHYTGAGCPRCGKRKPGEVVAEVNALFQEGIERAKSRSRLIAWDWGWQDAWVEDVISRLPSEVALMSVSEWDLPIERGGVKTTVGEYSLSSIGPGPRSTRHWAAARARGLKTIAKVQAANSWELSAVPYVPAVENTARHAANLRTAQLSGIMLGWTLGGYPSPNLEVVTEVFGAADAPAETLVAEAMRRVADRRFGEAAAPAVVEAWRRCSAAFREFPFNGGVVYQAPLQAGPSNLLCLKPTGYTSTMVGLPYDDLNGWRAVYPTEVFIGQLEKVAKGFDEALAQLGRRVESLKPKRATAQALAGEQRVIEAAAIHFRSVAQQARFVQARTNLAKAATPEAKAQETAAMETAARTELELARRMAALQLSDSRLGFEASNQYYYVPVDLAEKALNCQYILAQLKAGSK